MKYQKFCYFLFSSLLLLTSAVSAQQPSKPKRPVKNPPQFPNIIDLEKKDQRPATQTTAQPAGQENSETQPVQQADVLARAMMSVVGEMKALTQEIRSLNIRNQAQLDTLKLTRLDMRIDHYERELRPVRDRLAALDNDENTLSQMMTRESLMAQTANAPTFNRDELMKQVRLQHEARLRGVQVEKERLRKLEANLTQSLSIYQKLSIDTEQRIQDAEGALKQLESSQTLRVDKKP